MLVIQGQREHVSPQGAHCLPGRLPLWGMLCSSRAVAAWGVIREAPAAAQGRPMRRQHLPVGKSQGRFFSFLSAVTVAYSSKKCLAGAAACSGADVPLRQTTHTGIHGLRTRECRRFAPAKVARDPDLTGEGRGASVRQSRLGRAGWVE